MPCIARRFIVVCSFFVLNLFIGVTLDKVGVGASYCLAGCDEERT